MTTTRADSIARQISAARSAERATFTERAATRAAERTAARKERAKRDDDAADLRAQLDSLLLAYLTEIARANRLQRDLDFARAGWLALSEAAWAAQREGDGEERGNDNPYLLAGDELKRAEAAAK
jgi:hypothetical protein